MDYITLNTIRSSLDKDRERSRPEMDFKKILTHLDKSKADNDPLSFKDILDSNGLDYAIECLELHHDQNKVRLFACDIAERVLHIFEKEYPDDGRLRRALEVSRKFAKGKATKEELVAASADADATYDTINRPYYADGVEPPEYVALVVALASDADEDALCAADDARSALSGNVYGSNKQKVVSGEEQYQKELFIKTFGNYMGEDDDKR